MYYLLSLFIVFGYTTYKCKHILYNNLKNDSINYVDNLNFIKGFDLKYGLEKDNDTLLTEIKNNFMKKNILEKLKNPNISTFEKIKTIDDFDVFNDSMKVDFYKGGLMNDWNFTI